MTLLLLLFIYFWVSSQFLLLPKQTKGRPRDKITLLSFSRILTLTAVCPFSFAEQRKLKKSDVPLLQRLLQGPSKSNARIFLMDKDTEEISSDVWTQIASVWGVGGRCARARAGLSLAGLFSHPDFSFPFQVAQYINFHFSFLESILQRLDEEEKKETERIMAK